VCCFICFTTHKITFPLSKISKHPSCIVYNVPKATLGTCIGIDSIHNLFCISLHHDMLQLKVSTQAYNIKSSKGLSRSWLKIFQPGLTHSCDGLPLFIPDDDSYPHSFLGFINSHIPIHLMPSLSRSHPFNFMFRCDLIFPRYPLLLGHVIRLSLLYRSSYNDIRTNEHAFMHPCISSMPYLACQLHEEGKVIQPALL
jgi:hypothetical protein